jgi:multiple RNA-binding domain-containing protein 1
MDGKAFQGRLLHILPAIDRRGKEESPQDARKKSVKEARGDKRKEGAGRAFNWAMLYMNVSFIC